MKDTDYMKLAIKEAEAARQTRELPFGAVIIYKNKVIAQNHCREATLKEVTAHAELQAVRDACQKLKSNNLNNCTIYCTAEPCLMCTAAILQANISRIVFAASRSDLSHIFRQRQLGIKDLVQDSGYKPKITRGILRQRAIELFANINK